MKTLKIIGSVTAEGTANFFRLEVKKISSTCSECGNKIAAQNVFGNLFIPRSIGIPDQIVISINVDRVDH